MILCEHCGQPIPMVTRSGRRVKPSAYAKRQYCSAKCAGSAGPKPPTSKPGTGVGGSQPRTDNVRERFVALLVDYWPLPLTVEDVAEELSASPHTISTVATRLVREGRIQRRYVGREPLYSAPEGVRA